MTGTIMRRVKLFRWRWCSIEIFGRFFLIYKHATCYTGERERLQRTQGTIFWIMAIWMSKSRSVDGPDGSIELFDK